MSKGPFFQIRAHLYAHLMSLMRDLSKGEALKCPWFCKQALIFFFLTLPPRENYV